jgi:lipopolysaccharide export system ATP-binding protein
MALEKQLLLYDCRLVQPNSGNIYLDDLNITDYNVQRAQQESDIKKLLFLETKYRRQYLSVLQTNHLSKEEQVAFRG